MQIISELSAKISPPASLPAVEPSSRQLKVIGIAGANGKTTTSMLLASVLAAGGQAPGIVGTLGCFDGADWTAPADEDATPPAAN